MIGNGPQGKALRYTPDPCFAGTDHFGYSDFVNTVSGVVTMTVLPGACRVSVRRSSTDCATRTVSYTAANPFAVPARIIESGTNGPSDVRTFVVPARSTKVIFQFSADSTHPSTERFTFAIAAPPNTLFTDSVAFPCPAPADSGPQLPATGTALGRAGWGTAASQAAALAPTSRRSNGCSAVPRHPSKHRAVGLWRRGESNP